MIKVRTIAQAAKVLAEHGYTLTKNPGNVNVTYTVTNPEGVKVFHHGRYWLLIWLNEDENCRGSLL